MSNRTPKYPSRIVSLLSMALALSLAAAPVLAQPATEADQGGGSSFATTGSDPFAMGEQVLFAGISAGTLGSHGRGVVPPVHVGLDYAFHRYMTLGAIFGFSSYSGNVTHLSLAARGTFHPTMWFKNIRIPLDPYGIATVGYIHSNRSGPGDGDLSYLVLGPGVGVRYWFMPNLAGQAEAGVGRGAHLASVSIAFKL